MFDTGYRMLGAGAREWSREMIWGGKWEDFLKKEMATHSSILAWKIPWAEEPGGLQSMRSQKSQTQLSNWAWSQITNPHPRQVKSESLNMGSIRSLFFFLRFFFFYFFFLLLIFTLFYFSILYWFCHTLTWIHHGCTWVPNPEPPSHSISSLWVIPMHQPQASCILYRT